MCIDGYILSNHAFNRVIERLVLSQNIKLNKKQKVHNKKKACKVLTNDLRSYFAYSYFRGHKAIYTNLKNDGTCTKYIISDKNVIVTVLKDIDLYEEILKYKLYVNKSMNISLVDNDDLNRHNFFHSTIKENEYLFVEDSSNHTIESFTLCI